jgi:hypothetical protein
MLADSLIQEDFYNIDELANEGEEWFRAAPYNLTAGNAKFIVAAIKKGIEDTIVEAKKNRD